MAVRKYCRARIKHSSKLRYVEEKNCTSSSNGLITDYNYILIYKSISRILRRGVEQIASDQLFALNTS